MEAPRQKVLVVHVHSVLVAAIDFWRSVDANAETGRGEKVNQIVVG